MQLPDSLYEQILNNLSSDIVLYDLNGRMVYFNVPSERNRELQDSVIGKTEKEYFQLKGWDEKIAIFRMQKISEVIHQKISLQYEEEFVINSTRRIYYLQTFTPIFDSNKNVVQVLRNGLDITDRKKVEKEFEYIAYHDSLTGLPNRRLLYKKLEEIKSIEFPKENYISVVLLDLDRFKTINDTLGHHTGDELIRSVSGRLLGIFAEYSKNVIVSRLGGDEFVIVFFNLDNPSIMNQVATRIVKSFQTPFTLNDHELFVTTSIGIYTFHPKEVLVDPDEVINNADIAMYNAKENGRNKFQFYVDGMNTKEKNIFTLETKLYRALKNQEFEIYYQPKIELKTKKIRSVEALIRWRREGELLSPKDFLSTSEESGLILMIGKLVMEKSASLLAKIIKELRKEINVSINLSEIQVLDDSLIPNIYKITSEYKIRPDLFEFEIKENIIMKDVQQSLNIIETLHSMGIKIAIDNFGTGSSSLSKLKNCPVDIINIDRSFITNITDNYQDAAITGAIISMAQRLNIKVNAEGIETKEQLLFLKYLRCEFMQGFIFSKPISESDLLELLIKDPDYSPLFEEENEEELALNIIKNKLI